MQDEKTVEQRLEESQKELALLSGRMGESLAAIIMANYCLNEVISPSVMMHLENLVMLHQSSLKIIAGKILRNDIKDLEQIMQAHKDVLEEERKFLDWCIAKKEENKKQAAEGANEVMNLIKQKIAEQEIKTEKVH